MAGYIKLTGIMNVIHNFLGSSWIIIPSTTHAVNKLIIALHT